MFWGQGSGLIRHSNSTSGHIGAEQLGNRDLQRYRGQAPHLDHILQKPATLVDDQPLSRPQGTRVGHRHVHGERLRCSATLQPRRGETGQCCCGACRDQSRGRPGEGVQQQFTRDQYAPDLADSTVGEHSVEGSATKGGA
jgi:hypothetical protein